MKSNSALPCGDSSAAQAGVSGVSSAVSAVTSPCRKPRTSSPATRITLRLVSMVAGVVAGVGWFMLTT
jgi:hypothetical protein